MIKTRINPKTKKEEIWVQPEGLPGIWSERGFCDRCKPFNDCLGLREIDDRDWAQMEYDIHFGHMDQPDKKEIVEHFELCGKGCNTSSVNS